MFEACSRQLECSLVSLVGTKWILVIFCSILFYSGGLSQEGIPETRGESGEVDCSPGVLGQPYWVFE